MSSLTSVLPHIQSGKLKAYALAAPERAAAAPDIKTFAELGAGDVDGTIVYTLIAPPGTPAAAVAKLNEALNAGVSTPEMKEELRKRGFVAMVVLTCSENRMPSFFAASICAAKKARNAFRLITEQSMISPALSGILGLSTVTAPSLTTSSIRALVGAATVVATSEP